MFRVEVFTVHGEMGVGGFLLHNSCSVISFLVEALFQWGCWAQVCCMRACSGGQWHKEVGTRDSNDNDF